MRAFGRHYDTADGSIERLLGRNTSVIRKMVKEFDKGNNCKLVIEYLANVAHLWCVMMDGCKAKDEYLEASTCDANNADILIDSYFTGVKSALGSSCLRIQTGRYSKGDDGNEYGYRWMIVYSSYGTRFTLAAGNERTLRVASDEAFEELIGCYEFNSDFCVRANEEVFLRVCDRCYGEPHPDYTSATYGRIAYCEECARNMSVARCDFCGDLHLPGDLRLRLVTMPDGQRETVKVCDHCYHGDRYFMLDGVIMICRFCAHHQEHEVVELDSEWQSVPGLGRVCPDGIREMVESANLNTCAVCGSVHMEDHCITDETGESISLCEDCRESYCSLRNIKERRGINSYSFKPLPLFVNGEDCTPPMSYIPKPETMYLGIELEYDDGENGYEAASTIHENNEGLVYCKSDCSLDNGIELVTQPIRASYAVVGFDWDALLADVHECEYRSRETCGFHVHINRSYFGDKDSIKREASEARLIYLYDKFYDLFCRLGHRELDRAERWASRSDIRLQPDMEDDIDMIKRQKSNVKTRYRAVNQCSDNTVEIRLWHSSDEPQVIKNILDITQATARIAKERKLIDIMEMDVEGLKTALKELAVRPDQVERYIRETEVL